jgi:NAD(P)-dependent dehydrogenase (short-subunit alcohol dehydrogenase family)
LPPTERVALVTGGANGIGAAIVQRLRADGLSVASLDLTPAERAGVLDLECDVAETASIASAVDRVRAGLGPISVLVHAAAFQHRAPFDTLDPADWSRSFRVNVDGAFHLVRAALPDLRAADAGRIIMITSSSYFAPPPGMSHYIATKGALTGLVRGLSAELGTDGITGYADAPGLTATENALHSIPEQHFALVQSRQAIKRAGQADDIAGAVAYLASPDAGFVTGQTLLVDGGESRL